MQLRAESELNCLELEDTRNGSANLILSAKFKKAKMQHSLKRLLTKAYNFLKKGNLKTEYFCSLNKYAIKKVLRHNFAETYVLDNKFLCEFFLNNWFSLRFIILNGSATQC